MPNGTGVCYYNETRYFNDNFQDGIKEGKGEMHYLLQGEQDSIIKGYWNGNVYRGNKYTAYSFNTTEQFDITEITHLKLVAIQ